MCSFVTVSCCNVFNFGSEQNYLKKDWQIAIKFAEDIHGPQRMIPNFGEEGVDCPEMYWTHSGSPEEEALWF